MIYFYNKNTNRISGTNDIKYVPQGDNFYVFSETQSIEYEEKRKNGYRPIFQEIDNEIIITYVQKNKNSENISYWTKNSYDTLVENEIAKRYTIKQELAIQRQKDSKSEEYMEYYIYCEQCKTLVKEKLKEYNSFIKQEE